MIEETAILVPFVTECPYQFDAVADSDGNLNVACESAGNVYYLRRDAAGAWGNRKQINLDGAGLPIPGGYPSVAVPALDTDNIYISWDSSSGTYVSISDNAGANWPTLEQASDWWGDSSIAVGPDGDLHIAVYDSYVRGTKNGNSWSWTDPRIVYDTKGRYPSVAVDASGMAIILYEYYGAKAIYVTKEK